MLGQTVAQLCFGFFSRLPIVVEPKEVSVSSDTGILPIRQFDSQLGFSDRFIACLNDPRDPDLTRHGFAEMVRQRIYGIHAGYEDCNDHDTLRGDPVFKLVAGRRPDDDDLASQPTLSRFENVIDIPSLWKLHDFFIEDFIHSFAEPPSRITLDLDATDDAGHGNQQLALFHGFYKQYQYLPLIISCDETKQILWAALRPGTMHPAVGADDDLEYIVNRLRQAWPDVEIHVRGDSGFAMPWMFEVGGRLQLTYTFGLAGNAVLKRATEGLLQRAVERFEQTGEPARLFEQMLYRAGRWKNARRVIAKAECNRVGTNRRFMVTNREGAAVLPEACYDHYTERGESENRHKELKSGFSGDRLSCHRFLANYFRLQLHVAALNLLIRLRSLVADPPALREWDELDPEYLGVPVRDPTLPVEALTGSERRRYQNRRRQKDPLGRGQIDTWRMMLIKVAGEVTQSARRILITIPAHWPHLSWFRHVCQRIALLRCGAQSPT
ncbi:MAG: IS1380 family transposase [Acidimicrobiia bacterium]